ncbi:MAG: CPBP family intramembrane glutamic endopeptidase [Bacillota bacterium]
MQQALTSEAGSCIKPERNRQLALYGLGITGIIAAITVCEYIFAYRNVAYGIVMSLGLTILLYAFLAFRKTDDLLAESVESLVLVPMYILFTSSLPWFFISQQYLLPAVYTCIIGLCVLYIYQKGISFKELIGVPDRKRMALYVLMGAIGIPTGLVEYLILKPAPFYPEFTIKYLLLNLLYMLFFVGVGEEVLFRGLIQKNLGRLFGWKWGLVGASLLFSIMHLTWRSVPELFFVFLAGLIFGYCYIKTESLIASIIIHGVNNTMLVAVCPYVIK